MPSGVYPRTEKHCANLREAWKDPEVRAKRIANLKEAWKDLEVRAKRIEIQKIAQNKLETRAKHSGENNGHWKGGIGKLPYPFKFDKNLKKQIRERDHTCQLCGKTKEEEGKNLCVHHIDYNKNNLDLDNLIILCNSCNAKVNLKREFWVEFFVLKLDIESCLKNP
jgi:hypothetical protein